MTHPMLSAVEDFQRPPQLLRVDRQIPLEIGEHGQAMVSFVIHEKDENGTTLRVEDIQPADAGSNSSRTGTSVIITPSPSA